MCMTCIPCCITVFPHLEYNFYACTILLTNKYIHTFMYIWKWEFLTGSISSAVKHNYNNLIFLYFSNTGSTFHTISKRFTNNFLPCYQYLFDKACSYELLWHLTLALFWLCKHNMIIYCTVYNIRVLLRCYYMRVDSAKAASQNSSCS